MPKAPKGLSVMLMSWKDHGSTMSPRLANGLPGDGMNCTSSAEDTCLFFWQPLSVQIFISPIMNALNTSGRLHAFQISPWRVHTIETWHFHAPSAECQNTHFTGLPSASAQAMTLGSWKYCLTMARAEELSHQDQAKIPNKELMSHRQFICTCNQHVETCWGAFPVMLRGNAIAMKTLQCQAPFCTRLFSGKFLIPSNDQNMTMENVPLYDWFFLYRKTSIFSKFFPARKMTISPGPSRWDACLEHLQSPRAASDASKLSRCELFGGTLLKMVGPWGSSSQVFPTFPNHEAVNVQVSSCKGRSEVHPVRHQA